MVLFASLAVGLASLASSAAKGALRESAGNRAYYLALSGRNYLASLPRDDFVKLAGDSKTLQMGDAGTIEIVVGSKNESGDYPYRVTGTVNGGDSEQGAFILHGKRNGTGFINFADNLSEFASPVESDADKDIIVVNEKASSIILGGNDQTSYGAVWYGGESSLGGCKSGACLFGKGFRAYFDFTFGNSVASYANTGDGFVFAIVNGQYNDVGRCGGDTSMGELLGYGGPGNTADGKGLIPPKFGTEFDIYYNGGSGDPEEPGSRSDGSRTDHVAYVFWGWEDASGACGSGSGYDCSYDDNRHSRVDWRGNVVESVGSGIGGDQPVNPVSKDIADEDGYYVQKKETWLRSGSHSYRIEVNRAASPNAAGYYEYELKSWVDCSNCDDVLTDYAKKSPNLDKVMVLNEANNARFERFLFGWTMGSGVATQSAPVSNFKLAFK